eukprot:4239207-Pyramimonas_sp.AAC.1
MVDEIEMINITAGRRATPDEPCNDQEISALRAVAGSLNYVGRETRPDLSGPVSLLQGTFPKPKVSDLLEGNR